ncbi:MAG: NAD(P)-binding domain-containing protein [Vulcanimicrobiaceae bacterium]
MKIGILGSGDVGQSLGRAFLTEGHDVMVGTRDPAAGKLDQWQKEAGSHAQIGTFTQTAQFGDVLIVATLWSGTKRAIELAGSQNFAGKTVIDATNPLQFAENAPPGLALGHTDSGGEQVQRWLPGAHVVKAFNTVGNAYFYKPKFSGGPPTMFVAGNDAGAKCAVADLLDAFGWETVDAGGIEASRLLEPLCLLWVNYGVSTGTWHHAFKLLR